MRSNPEFSPRLLVAVCWSVLGVLFSIPAVAHPVYLTGEEQKWAWDVMSGADTSGSYFQVLPQVSIEWGDVDDITGVRVTGSYESQQQSSDGAFSFSARSSVTAEGTMSSDYTTLYPQSYPGYWGEISQSFYYVEFLVTEEVLFLGNLPLTDALFPTQHEQPPAFGAYGEVFLSGSVLGPGTYSYWSGCRLLTCPEVSIYAFDGFASVGSPGTDLGGPGTASYSSFTQFIDMRFTATAVPTPSALMLSLGGFGLMLFARSRHPRNRRGERRIVSES